MRLRLPLLLLTSLLTAFALPSQATATDGSGTLTIYLLTGQSNAEGALWNNPLPTDLLNAYQSSKTQLWYNNITKTTGASLGQSTSWGAAGLQLPTYSNNKCMGPEYGFLYMMEKKGWQTSGADNVAVIKVATDGGGNEYWIKTGTAYQAILSTVKTAVAALDTTKYHTVNLAGLLYLQGESNNATGAQQAVTRYETLIKNLKEDLAAEGLGNINVTIDQSVLGEPSRDVSGTISNLQNYATSTANTEWVITSDLKKGSDNLHFSGTSQISIGARYAYQVAVLNKLEVGTVRSQENAALDTAAAWWGDGLSNLQKEVAEWDVSSSTKPIKISDTVGKVLEMYGISVADTNSESATTITLLGGASSSSAPSSSDTTLALGKGGLSVGGVLKNDVSGTSLQFNRKLVIGANVKLNEDQTWSLGGGSSVTLTGVGSAGGSGAVKNLITGNGNVTIHRKEGTTGTASVVLNQDNQAGAARTWTLGDGVSLSLSQSQAWGNNNFVIESGASAVLGGYSATSLTVGSLSLGDNAQLTLGSSGSLQLSTSSLTLGGSNTLKLDIGVVNFDSIHLTGSSTTDINGLTFDFSYAAGLSSDSSYTIMTNVSGDVANLTWNSKVSALLSSTLTIDASGNLILSFSGSGTSSKEFVECSAGGDNLSLSNNKNGTNGSSIFDATLAAGSTGEVVSTKTTSTSITSGNSYYYVTSSTHTGDVYGELSGVSCTWASAAGSNSYNTAITLDGDANLKISSDENNTAVSIGNVYGAVNATSINNVYVELADKNATYTSTVNGAFKSQVNGSITMLISAGTFNSSVFTGAVAVNGSQTIAQGTSLTINGGTFKNTVTAGGSAGTILNGASLSVNGGSFSNIVSAAGTSGGTVDGGASLYITGGTFSNNVYGANGSTVTGDISMIITGGTFTGSYILGSGASNVTGNVDMVITGGNVSNSTGIYAGSGSANTGISSGGNTKITLLNIDDENDFANFSGVLSGGNLSTGGTTISGTKTLVLDNFTASSIKQTLQDFNVIQLSNGSITTTKWSNMTLASSVILDAGTQININGDGKNTNSVVTLGSATQFSGTGTLSFVGDDISVNYLVNGQIMSTGDGSQLTGLNVGANATLIIDTTFTSDNALKVGNLSGSGTINGHNGGAGNRYIQSTQTSDNIQEFSGAFVLDTTSGGDRSVGLIKDGVGTLLLSGDNTSTADLKINGGSLLMGNNSTSGSWDGAISVGESGTLVWNRSDDVARDGNLTVDGVLSQLGTGTLTLSNVKGSGALNNESYRSLVVTDITGFIGKVHGEDGSNTKIGGYWEMGDSNFTDKALVTLLKGATANTKDYATYNNGIIIEENATLNVGTEAGFMGGVLAENGTLTKSGEGVLSLYSSSLVNTLNVTNGEVNVIGDLQIDNLTNNADDGTVSKISVLGNLGVSLSDANDSSCVDLEAGNGGSIYLTGSGDLNSLQAGKGGAVYVSPISTGSFENSLVTLMSGLEVAGSVLDLTLNTDQDGFADSPIFSVLSGDINLDGATIRLGSLEPYGAPQDPFEDLRLTLVSRVDSPAIFALADDVDATTNTYSTSANDVTVETEGYFAFYYSNVQVVTTDSEIYLTGTVRQNNPFTSDILTTNATSGANLLWGTRGIAPTGTVLGDAREAVRHSIQSGDSAGAAKAMAAIAGSTINATGTAQRDALRSQLSLVRNRTTQMGVNPAYVNADLPYFHLWLEGTGSFAKLNTDGDEGGYKLNTWGGTVGMDVDLSDRLTIGAALSANYGDLSASAAEVATGSLDSYYVSLFGRYQSKRWAHTLILTGGWNNADLNRTVHYGSGSYSTQGSTNGYGIGAMYEVTYDVALNESKSSILQPLANLSVVHTGLDAYTESGAGNAGLNVGRQEWTTATVALGTRWLGLVGSNIFGREALAELRVNAAQDMGDSQGKTDVSFRDLPDLKQEVRGAKAGSTALQIGAGLSIPVGLQSTIYCNGNADIRSGASALNATLGFRYNF